MTQGLHITSKFEKLCKLQSSVSGLISYSVYDDKLRKKIIQFTLKQPSSPQAHNASLLMLEFISLLSTEDNDTKSIMIPVAADALLDEQAIDYLQNQQGLILALSFTAAESDLLNHLANLKRDYQLKYCISYPDLQLIQQTEILKFDYLAVNMQSATAQQLTEVEAQAKRIKATLLFEGIANEAEFETVRQLHAALFQGSYFNHNIKKVPQDSINNLDTVTNLLALVNQPNTQYNDLSKILSTEPALVTKLLRLLNSASMKITKEVTGLQHALMLLGLDRLKAFLSLIIIHQSNPFPSDLISHSIMRAYMCEKLSARLSMNVDSGYFVGLMSSLDQIFNIPMSEILSGLHLCPECSNAILHYEGKLGQTLKSVIEFLNGDWEQLRNSGELESCLSIYIEAMEDTLTLESLLNKHL